MAFPKRNVYSPELQKLSGWCSALGYPVRLALLASLADHDYYVHELVRLMPITQGAVSSHLKKLRDSGLIEVRTEGLYNKYMLDLERLVDIRKALESYIEMLVASRVAGMSRGGGVGEKTGQDADSQVD